MRQPREGEVLWRRLPGGRAKHAITRESFPSAVCGVEPGDDVERWRVRDYSWRERRRHKHCQNLAPRGRINFWEPDYEE